MLRSMYSGVSGLRSHQVAVDVVGNNIANVNTVGYKSQGAVFADVLYQLQQAAGGPEGQRGGVNPSQVGLGVRVAGINQNFNPGSLQTTGRASDIAIQGEGFLILNDGQGGNLFTRAGQLEVDSSGNLVTQQGLIVQGYTADAAGNIPADPALGNLTLPLNGTGPASETSEVDVTGNLPASAAIGDTRTTRIDVVDQDGNSVGLTLTFEKTAADEWTVTAADDNGTAAPVAGGVITFDPGTNRPTVANPTVDLTALNATAPLDFTNAAATIDLAAANPDGLSQFANVDDMAATSQDGTTDSNLTGFTIGPDGSLNGLFDNGQQRVVGQVALTTFPNPGGLERVGGTAFRATVNSGGIDGVVHGAPGQAGNGVLVSGTVEASNVDLSEQFTNLILAQRGYQANARVITTSDEILQELVNLK